MILVFLSSCVSLGVGAKVGVGDTPGVRVGVISGVGVDVGSLSFSMHPTNVATATITTTAIKPITIFLSIFITILHSLLSKDQTALYGF